MNGGEIVHYNFNEGKFTSQWTESSELNAPTIFYIPDIKNLDQEGISIEPEAKSISIEPIENSGAGYLVVPAMGNDGDRAITFTISKIDSASVSN